jgi:predicted MFS family arabinose efflux permease
MDRVSDEFNLVPAPRGGLIRTLRQTTFRSLRHRNYRRYFLGQFISFTGTWMQSAALMWLIYDQTHDIRWPSYLLVAQVGPTVLFGPWGGSLADRAPKRRLIMITQSIFLVNAVILTGMVGSGLIIPWLIIVLQVLNGVVQAVDLPARLAFLPDLVPKEDLINAVGLNSLLFNSARAIGPAITGLLFLATGAIEPYLPFSHNPVTFGAVCCFSLNAISFLAVIVALNGIRVPGDSTHDPDRQPRSIWDGVHYLMNHAALGGLVVLTLLLCIFAWPTLTLFPGYTRERLGLAQETYSFLVSALGGGALVAALTTATFGSSSRRATFLVLGAAVTALGISGLAMATVLSAAVGGASAVGFGLILFLSTGQSTLQLAVPDDVRGRVMALWAMTLSASAPIGHLLAGQLAELWGVETVFTAMAAGTGLVALGLALIVIRRGLRS